MKRGTAKVRRFEIKLLNDALWRSRSLLLAKIIKMKIQPINDFGFSPYFVEDKMGIIYENFTKIIPPVYEDILPAFTGHFWAKENGSWHLKSFKNRAVISNNFKLVNRFYQKFACVSEDGAHFGFIDFKGKFIIPQNYFGGKFLGLDFFAVKNSDDKFGVIDFQEKMMHPFTLEKLPTFSEIVIYLLERRKPLREWLQI